MDPSAPTGPALPDGIGYPQDCRRKISRLRLFCFPELLGAMGGSFCSVDIDITQRLAWRDIDTDSPMNPPIAVSPHATEPAGAHATLALFLGAAESSPPACRSLPHRQGDRAFPLGG